ncbi:metallophosphoesterase [uncultured Nocardioides sp.]|uniref:metallophosphoesterase n=1 Tax=uncultured Nocardioides sp. TaxID=198441 RepID=UPI0026334743|nr:metallophosphoesterase [uncultured Nocardioides sp.]
MLLPRLLLVLSLGLSALLGSAAAASADDTDPRFTIGVIPDTQNEVSRSGDDRFAQRTRWLAGRATGDDLRFVVHTGDVTDWGWAAGEQLSRARSAMDVLGAAGVPWQLALGNHDSRRHGWNGQGGYGSLPYTQNPECTRRFGSACNDASLLRRTDETDAAFARSFAGRFEADRIANAYRNFEAGGLRWMVLSLEPWPRAAVVEWAKSVAAHHPRRNIVIATHSYLDENGRIASSAEYGATSPQQLWQQLVSQYANIKVVLSGHTGAAAYRTDTGVKGNKVASFLGAFHSPDTNPVRLLTVDPTANSLTTRIFTPSNGAHLTRYDATVTGMGFVRP